MHRISVFGDLKQSSLGGGLLATGGLLAENGSGLLATLLVLDELFEGLHGHLIGGADSGLLATGGGSRLLARGRLLALSNLPLAGGELHHLLDSACGGRHLLLLVLAHLGGSLDSALGSDSLDLSGAGSNSGLLASAEGNNGGGSLLEVPVVTLGGDDVGSDVTLTDESGVLGSDLASSLNNSLVAKGLDGGLELIITVKVGGPSGGVELLAELGLEGVHNKANLEASVGGEHGVGVNLLELEGPVVDEDNFLLEVLNFNVGELLLEFVKGRTGEVCGHEEEGVRDEEVGLGLFDEDLEHLVLDVLGELREVTRVVDHIGEEGLEGGVRHF